MKRILTIQDISCLGKCSMTIALPVLSAMGIETVPLPTALLSTHTGFSGNTFYDLTGEIRRIADHWKKEGVCFDAVYIGYLGSEEEAKIVKDIIRIFSEEEKPFVFVDPVMGDHGKLYRGFTDSYVEEIRSLCREADMIVPNYTEGCLMAGVPYSGAPDRKEYEAVLSKIVCPGQTAAITGVSLSEDMTGVLGIMGEKVFEYQTHRLPYSYHGTGDLFASTAVGGILRGLPADRALRLACDYTARTIEVTAGDPSRIGQGEKYGILFEETIPELLSALSREI